MEKHFIPLVLLASLALVGCAAPAVGASSSDVVSDTSSEVVSSSSESSTDPLPVSQWGEELGAVLQKNLGTDLPYLPNDSFTYEDTVDAYGDPMAIIYCFYDSEENLDAAGEAYAVACFEDGYDVTLETIQSGIYVYDCYFADKVIESNHGIELQFLIGAQDGVDCLGIFAYNYTAYDENIWPGDLIAEYLDGQEIPAIEGEGYTYAYWEAIDEETGDKFIEVQIYGVSYGSDEEYSEVLIAEGYTISDPQEDEFGGVYYYASSSDYTIGLIYCYDLNYGALIIDILNLTL